MTVQEGFMEGAFDPPLYEVADVDPFEIKIATLCA
jgi:hypothetical protein